MVKFLRHQLAHSRRQEPLSATRLFERQRSQRAMICLFLAILELVKLRSVELVQSEAFGDIGLTRGSEFESVPDSAEELATLDEDYR
jgi:segregation and condensation protein A